MDLDGPLIITLVIDEIDPVIALLESLGPFRNCEKVFQGTHRHTEMIESRAGHRFVIGNQKYELIPMHAAQNQPMTVESHVGHFGESKNLVEKVTKVFAINFVE